MSVTCEDLLAYAVALQVGPGEPEFRASVSRAYYAAYHRADAWHDALPSPGSATNGANQGVHALLIDRLRNPTVNGKPATSSRSIAYMLQHMKASRTVADYKLDQHLDQAVAATVVASAANLIAKAV